MINLSSNHNDISHESFLSILYFSGFLLSLPSRLFKKLISFSLFDFNTINPLVLSVVYLDSWLPLFHLSLKCCKTKNLLLILLKYNRTIRSLYLLDLVLADTPIILSISTQSISNLSVTPLIFCILITTHIIEYCINPFGYAIAFFLSLLISAVGFLYISIYNLFKTSN